MSIEATLEKYEDKLLGLPNVTGIGIGEKNGREAIIVFVSHKVPDNELRSGEAVPKTLDGVPTDVMESGVITTQSHH